VHRISLANLRRLSQFPSPQLAQIDLSVLKNNQPINRQHPLLDKLPAVTSFDRVSSTSPFLAAVHVYRPPSTDVGIFVDELDNVLATVMSGCSDHLLLCGTSTKRRRLAQVLMNACQWGSRSSGWLNTSLYRRAVIDFSMSWFLMMLSRFGMCLWVKCWYLWSLIDHSRCSAAATNWVIRSSLNSHHFSKFDTATFESILLSSVFFISPKTEVVNFTDQLERVVASALDAICPFKTRHVRFSRRAPLSAATTIAKRRRRERR